MSEKRTKTDVFVELLRAKRPEFYSQFSDKHILACFDETKLDRLIDDLRTKSAEIDD